MDKSKSPIYFLLLVILSGVISSCSHRVSFYSIGSGLDYLRFPILKPYYAIKIDEENGWAIPLQVAQSKQNFWLYTAILNVKQIDVQSGIIFINSTFTEIIEITPGVSGKELHWFIIIPDQMEYGYETEDEFIDAVNKLGLKSPDWKDPDTLLNQFDQTGCLDWYPDCN